MNSSSEGPSSPRGPEVVARGLVVSYGGKTHHHFGLRGFDATFSPGITGLVGPNGAGKTTFLRTVCGLLTPSEGGIEIQGMTPASYVRERGMGFLPESPTLPRHLTVEEFLGGIPPFPVEISKNGAGDPWIQRVEELLDRRCDALSLGQRKKVALAAALKGNPEVLLLDEPTNGLDPLATKALRRTLLEERERGITMIVSSHHLDELQRMADTLVFVNAGGVVGSWTQAEAMREFSSLVSLFDHVMGGGDS